MTFKATKDIYTPRGTPLLFFPFGFLVKRPEVSPEGKDHDNGQPIVRDTNTVKVSVSLTLDLRPDVRAGDVTQLTERVNESDSHNSLRGQTEERGADPRKKGDGRSIRLCHLEHIKSCFEPPIKAGN
jgi:hypothetical protein